MDVKSEAVYSAKIFLNSVIALLKVLAEDPIISDKVAGKAGVLQIAVMNNSEKWATHLNFTDNGIDVKLGLYENPDVELLFPKLEHFNAFFKGETKKPLKIKGFTKLGFLILSFRLLL